MLDQQDLVPALVVDELIGHLAGDQHAESAWPQPFLLALQCAGHDILGIVRPRRMRQVVGVEAGARILEVIDNGAGRLCGGDLDDFLRIEAGAMLHGVEEQLAKRGNQQVSLRARRGRLLQLGHETSQPVGGDEVAGDAQRQPVWQT